MLSAVQHASNSVRSTKMKRMVELIEAVAEEDATQKVLVFSQFTSFLDLVSRDLKDQGIFHESYVGSSACLLCCACRY
jgi:SNF2 family DNA or RNA helicase